ncbi:MAG: 1,4-dihydroxy-6-naphthoate synthase [Planctomycetes bacterium]|nr:1,4-dihydroxy-6-naphthoate synthase [Planctomycetota bacterium]
MHGPLRFGISTCPNDTFCFHGLLTGAVRPRGLDLSFELLDVQELNEGLYSGRFDAAKISFHAALALSESHVVLPVGSALGFGNGPLLLSARPQQTPAPGMRVLGPGALTTATLLFQLFHGAAGAELEQTVFDRIMPALREGHADLGICIHEGRFTYRNQGLFLVEDLGLRWQSETQSPLPLGGLLARRELGPEVLHELVRCIRESLELAWCDRTTARDTMRRYAQELSDEVIDAHVDLYVNEYTRELGPVGRDALSVLSTMAAERGGLAKGQVPLSIFA